METLGNCEVGTGVIRKQGSRGGLLPFPEFLRPLGRWATSSLQGPLPSGQASLPLFSTSWYSDPGVGAWALANYP